MSPSLPANDACATNKSGIWLSPGRRVRAPKARQGGEVTAARHPPRCHRGLARPSSRRKEGEERRKKSEKRELHDHVTPTIIIPRFGRLDKCRPSPGSPVL